MPSHLHEALVQLFRSRPLLAPELLESALCVKLPRYTDASIHAGDLTEVRPVEYRADLVVLLLRGKPVLGIVVEVQLARDLRKRYVWPVYAASLRAAGVSSALLVVTHDDDVARWAAQPIDMGGNGTFTPLVIGPVGRA